MKLGWVSDVHLNFLDVSGRGRFFNVLSAHEGEISSSDWLPWFSCQATGAAIAEVAAAHPDTQFLVLCGHTHSGGQYSPRVNIDVRTASAEYGRPAVQGVIELDEGERLHVV